MVYYKTIKNNAILTIRKIVNIIVKKIKKGKPIYNSIKSPKYENKSLFSSIAKSKKILKWEPKIDLNQGLDITIKSFKK